MAPWIFVAGRIKEGALSERSEFGSFPSPRHKSKESFAISGAPFFCLAVSSSKCNALSRMCCMGRSYEHLSAEERGAIFAMKLEER
ncbi:hypothetical protein ACU8YE_23450, partial [Ralstonia sp. VS2407]